MSQRADSNSADARLITNLPPEQGPFVGRDAALAEIERHFFQAKPARRRVAIVGSGGIGKSTLATRFAWMHQSRFTIIWRIRAASPSTTATDLAQLARRMGMAGGDDARAAGRWVRRELQRRSDWLVILDNALAPEDISDAFAWGSAAGHVLLTSQNPNWKPLAATVVLRPWARRESLEFFEGCLGSQIDRELGEKLATALGDLPLAMQQATACIVEGNIKPDDYLREFESHWGQLLQRGKPSVEYPASCAMAWELSFRQIESMDPVAADVMNLCAFLAPDGVPFKLILDGAQGLQGRLADLDEDASRLAQSVELLQKFALVQGSEDAITMHRVIAYLTRDRLPAADRIHWAGMALAAANQSFCFDSQDHATWPKCAEALPHLLAAATFGQVVELSPALLVEAMDRAGRYLLKQGQFAEARYALEMAWNLVRKAFGDKSARAADIANNLGRVMHRLGEFGAAQRLFEFALRFDRRTYGETDVRVATVANNYAMTLASLGHYDAARGHFEMALKIYADRGLAPNARTAGVMNNLGFVLLRLNDLGAAGEALAEALAITQQVQGTEHPNVACILSNLGRMHTLKHDLKQALDLYMHALAIDQRALGQHHPAVARDLAAAGDIAYSLGQLDSAESMFIRALAIQESAYGMDHLILARHLNDLGRCQKAAGKAQEAAKCFERASLIAADAQRGSGEGLLSADELATEEA